MKNAERRMKNEELISRIRSIRSQFFILHLDSSFFGLALSVCPAPSA
jgi:hypothetical protein